MTLQDIAAKIQARLQQATNPSASFDILTIMGELVQVLQTKGIPIGDDAAKIAKLEADKASLNSLLDNDAETFLSIKAALGNANLTQGEIANEIKTKWRHI